MRMRNYLVVERAVRFVFFFAFAVFVGYRRRESVFDLGVVWVIVWGILVK